MARYAIVNTTNNTVLTVVEYATTPPTPPPGYAAGVIAIQSDQAGGNWLYDGTTLSAPTPPAMPPNIYGASGATG